jgi:3-phenylpropionate/cinnamic acid dioxygenase small subunit
MSLSAEDKLAIAELLARSAYAFDEQDLEMLEACFTPDAVFSILIKGGDMIGPFEGRDAVMKLYSDSMDAQTDVRRHVASNVFFKSETGDPQVISNLTLFATENATTKLLSVGVYQDTVRRTDDGWRVLKRHLDLDSPY